MPDSLLKSRSFPLQFEHHWHPKASTYPDTIIGLHLLRYRHECAPTSTMGRGIMTIVADRRAEVMIRVGAVFSAPLPEGIVPVIRCLNFTTKMRVLGTSASLSFHPTLGCNRST